MCYPRVSVHLAPKSVLDTGHLGFDSGLSFKRFALGLGLSLNSSDTRRLPLNLQHLPSDTRTIAFLVVISLVLATPILYICIRFMKVGRRSLVSPIRRQNSEQHHQGVEPTPMSLNHPPPACTLPACTSRLKSLDFFDPESFV